MRHSPVLRFAALCIELSIYFRPFGCTVGGPRERYVVRSSSVLVVIQAVAAIIIRADIFFFSSIVEESNGSSVSY